MCNQSFEEITGAEKAELIGKTVYRYFDNEEVAFHIQKDMELIRTKSTLTYEKNGFPGKNTYLISKNLVFDRHHEPKGIVSVFTDISEIKRANEEIINVKKAELISGTIKLMNVNELNSNLIADLQKLLPLTGNGGQKYFIVERIVKNAEKSEYSARR